MRRSLIRLLSGVLLLALAGVPPSTAAATPFAECAADPPREVVVGRVACQRLHSVMLGGTTAFSYYVPPVCDPRVLRGRRCPTLYLLHGFGGDYTSMLGTAAHPSAWVSALTSEPPEDPNAVSDPWTMQDPAGWVPASPIGFILVAPHGQTLDGGDGPAGGLDGYWTDWNPRLAGGGDSERYRTPPPRFESFMTGELIPFVERTFPTRTGRSWRAIAGNSLGGYGAYKLGLQHPDLWSSIGSVSGPHNFLFAPVPDPIPGDAPAALAPPVPLPRVPVPSAPSAVSLLLPEQARGYLASFFAFGDPTTEQARYRGNMPFDLAMNGRAWAGRTQSLHIRGFVNNAVARRAEDLGPSYPTSQAYEAIVLPMNLDMDLAFQMAGVARGFEIHPGLHSDAYWNPFLRKQLVEQYARVRHTDGRGSPTPMPTLFDFRSISTDFAIWGWRFRVLRDSIEFLTLRDVSCRGLTLRGTGVVTVTIPAACGTRMNGARSFNVDLGPAFPTDEPAGASNLPAYGRTVRVDLS